MRGAGQQRPCINSTSIQITEWLGNGQIVRAMLVRGCESGSAARKSAWNRRMRMCDMSETCVRVLGAQHEVMQADTHS